MICADGSRSSGTDTGAERPRPRVTPRVAGWEHRPGRTSYYKAQAPRRAGADGGTKGGGTRGVCR